MSEETFEDWAKAAANEEAPRPDVASAVLTRLREPEPAPAAWPWASVTGCAAAFFAVWLYQDWLAFLGDWYGCLVDFDDWSLL